MMPSKDFEKVMRGKEKYLILEVGNYNTKMIEVSPQSGKMIVSKGFIIATPEGTIDDDVILNSDELIKQVKEKILEEKITSRQVTVSLSSKEIVTREMAVPAMNNRDLLSYIKTNSNDLFPVDLEDYTLGYVSMPDTSDSGNKLIIVAIPNDIIAPYVEVCEKLGLILKSVNFSGFELYNLIDFELGKNSGTYAVIDLGSKNTNFIIVSRGMLMYNRVLKLGSDDVTQGIAEHFKCTLTKAEKIKRDYNSVIMEGSLKPTDDVYVVAGIFRNVISDILTDISNLIEFYNANHSKAQVSKIYIIGLATKISGISEFVESVLNIETEKIKEFERVVFDEKAKQVKRRQVTLENCLGAIPVDGKKLSLIKGKLQLAKFYQVLDPMTYKVGIAVACVAVLILCIINFLTFTVENGALEYNTYIKEKNEIREAQNWLIVRQNELDRINKVISSIPNGIESKKDLLEKLDEANASVPGIAIDKYTISEAGNVTITVTASDEFTALDFEKVLGTQFEIKSSATSYTGKPYNLQLVAK